MSWDHEVDVVVLGTGGAGLTAALTAAVAGASVEVFEKAPTVGGTTAVSGGVVWIPAHNRSPDGELTVGDALRYLRAQSLGSMDDEMVETFVRTGPAMLDFVEAHSGVRFEIATGFPDYRPELPGGQPGGGRSLIPAPYDLDRLGEWATRITAFPADFSNVGFDAETRARLHAAADEQPGNLCVAGAALIAGLLDSLLDTGATVHTNARAEQLIADGGEITGVQIALPETDHPRARPARSHPGHRRLRMGSRSGASLSARPDARCGLSAVQHRRRAAHGDGARRGPGQHGRSLVGADRADPGRHHRRASPAAAACVWSEPARGASSSTPRGGGSSTRRPTTTRWPAHSNTWTPAAGTSTTAAWMVFDSVHLQRYGFLGVAPGEPVPDWFCESADLVELAAKTGIDADGLTRTVEDWNRHVAAGADPDFGRGSSAYDGYWGDDTATTLAGKTLGPIDTAPYYAVPVCIGAMGTKGGPRTDPDGRVLHVSGEPIPGLFAAGNAMGGVTGRAYGGAGGTIGPAMVFGYRAGHAAATGKSVD